MFLFCFPDLFCLPAFWDATRAFMLLAVLSCFAGVVLGLSAFTNGTKNKRVRTGGIALLLSGNTTHPHCVLQALISNHQMFRMFTHAILRDYVCLETSQMKLLTEDQRISSHKAAMLLRITAVKCKMLCFEHILTVYIKSSF